MRDRGHCPVPGHEPLVPDRTVWYESDQSVWYRTKRHDRHLDTSSWVTDGGLETDLIFHHGVELPEFAAFPLVEDERRPRAARPATTPATPTSPRGAGAGLLLETPTWRANPDWAAKVGYDAAALDRVNRASVELMQGLRERTAASSG